MDTCLGGKETAAESPNTANDLHSESFSFLLLLPYILIALSICASTRPHKHKVNAL